MYRLIVSGVLRMDIPALRLTRGWIRPGVHVVNTHTMAMLLSMIGAVGGGLKSWAAGLNMCRLDPAVNKAQRVELESKVEEV